MKSSRPTVSVVIPTFNRAEQIIKAVHSVLHQTFFDMEIIVVDDYSLDNTAEKIKQIFDRRVRYIRHDYNRGASAARNTGIEASNGELVAFLDSDDQWLPAKIEKQLGILQDKRQEISVVYTGVIIVDETNRVKSIKVPGIQGFSRKDLLYFNCVGTASTVLLKKECLLHIGGFDPALASCQDWDLWLRLSKLYRFAPVPEALVKQLDHTRNISSNPTAVTEGHLALFAKHKEMYRKSPDFTPLNRARATEITSLGRRLWKFGAEANNGKALKKARRILLCSFLTYPFYPQSLIYYCTSLLGIKAYLGFVKYKKMAFGKRTRKFKKTE